MRLLLISSSFVYGKGYLDHCVEEIEGFLESAQKVLFVPFALSDRDRYTARVAERFSKIGCTVESIHQAGNVRLSIERAEAIFIGGGNTFRLLKALYDADLIELICRQVREGIPFIGSSAGVNVACPTIKTTNDMPIVFPSKLDGLNLIPFNINPHYIDPDPTSHHMGESRESRLREFLEENDLPVVGLREAAMLRREGERLWLSGDAGGRLFIKGLDPRELVPGACLDFLLKQRPDVLASVL